MLGQRLCCLQPTVMLRSGNDLNGYFSKISKIVDSECAKFYRAGRLCVLI